jgi:hypothetical protein
MIFSGQQRYFSRRLTRLKTKSLLRSRVSTLYFTGCHFSDDISFASRKVDEPQKLQEVEKAILTNNFYQSQLLRVHHSKFLEATERLNRGRASNVQILEGRRYFSTTPILNPKAVRNMIDGLCDDVSDKMLDLRIVSFFSQCLPKCTVEDTAALFQVLKHLRTKTDLGYYTPALALHLESLSCLPWTYRDVSEVIDGLQHLEGTGIRYQTIIRIIAKIVSDTAGRGEIARRSDVQRAIEVWKHIELGDESTLELLSSMALMVDSCREQFDPETLQSTMIVFQGMSSKDEEVELLLSAMARKIHGCDGTLSAEGVSVCLASLRRMTSESRAVLDVLRELAPLIRNCHPPYTNNFTARALFGLRGMSSDHEEVLLVLAAMLPLFNHFSEPFSSHDTGIALFGLQNMRSDRKEVRGILTCLLPFITSNEPLQGRSIGGALFGLRGMKSGLHEVDRVIEALVPRIESSNGFIAPELLAKAFYGLQNKASNHPPVKSLLEALVPVMLRCSSGTFTPAMVSEMLFALQGMQSIDFQVRNLLFVLRPLMLKCNGVMNAPLIAAYLQGMQNMTDFDEVHGLLSVACIHLSESSDPFGSHETSMALLGLRSMTADYGHVREILHLLAPRVRNDIPLDAMGVKDSMCGLVGMSSDCPEVCEVLQALVPRIQSCKETFEGWQIASILRSLTNLSTESADVRSLLSALTHHVQRCPFLYFPHKIGHSILGLQCMSGEHLESQQLMAVLTPLIVRDIRVIDMVSLVHILYGLQGMYSTQSVILSLINKRISQSHELERLDNRSFRTVSNKVLLCLPLLKNALDDAAFEGWDSMARRITKELGKRDLSNILKPISTRLERRVANNAMIVAKGTSMTVSQNKVVCGLFECDILLTVPLDSQADSYGGFFMLNLEVDGHTHMTATLTKYDKLRDDYLSTFGIQTRREQVKTLMNMSDGSIQKWIQECLADAAVQFALSKPRHDTTRLWDYTA